MRSSIWQGSISSVSGQLPPPLPSTVEAFIDIIEVRAWSSADKNAAIPMWRALGFALCPATTYPRGAPVDGYFVARVLV